MQHIVELFVLFILTFTYLSELSRRTNQAVTARGTHLVTAMSSDSLRDATRLE
jgi:hypothetical protein